MLTCHTYPNYEKHFPKLKWDSGPGQLTLHGMKQHLQLGSFLRDRYKDFLSAKYVPGEIQVQATDFDRTLQSALSNMAGLFQEVSTVDTYTQDDIQGRLFKN